MLTWNDHDLQEWILSGCDNKIALKVIRLVINNNKIKVLNPEIGYLINLEHLDYDFNEISELIPEIGNLIHLKQLSFASNKITKLIPEIGSLINLEILNISTNKISNLIPEIGSLINLEVLDISTNKISKLIPEIYYLTHLKIFYCSHNKITELISEICNLINLHDFYYSNNPIEYINPQILRFLNAHKNIHKIYNDSESVHNHKIQDGITNSIKYIMSINPTIKKDKLNILIINNKVLTKKTKTILIEYCDNNDIHSLLNITFQELLLNIYSLILKNDNRDEIFKIMNIEMNDSLCKCFTGRISRLVNCLNGIDHNIQINISDNEQIGNIIILIKNKLILENNYDLESHKKLVKTSLLERGYELKVIDEWIEYCE